MNYKFLILDIDDTLLNSQRQITPKTRERLMQLQEDGYYLVLASGRPTKSMIETAKELKLDQYHSYIISFNGAVITKMDDESELYSKRLELEEQREIIDYIQAQSLSVISYTDDEIIIDYENDYSHIEAELTGIPYHYSPEYISSIETPQLKLIGVGNPTIVEEVNTALDGQFGQSTYATTSKPYFIEFMHREVSKGDAIKKLVSHLGYTVEQVVACGDGNNDASMIEVAGVGVAMANATDYLKSLADEITKSNDDDGLVDVMNQYFNGKSED
ncbi:MULTISPECIES: Cof-type HAD-IIB family hydrolase [unclassified Facklamia]|uniref:Cof-type HAD-IIB family hydrolase n=1 Tax=Aerococcaceae TaxID=186827 RepID=UPI0013B90BF4|nr:MULTISPECIES: Cof-type HAD-IIB family hydrolase [unclassified Facklamia]NEW64831.1 Cof-type HAD-IIB family hydrolase [Facklamia sp. 252]NEW68153.1 Cof-type HAD-IIB family hydrolase [Facklamia sp. 253]QQD64984.1 HAD family phosphatase [Aerococcaceae bacterium zg-252]